MGRAKPPVVLVVEQDPVLRTDVAETLTVEGYLVLQVDSPAHALIVLERRQDVEVLFTDIDMPGDNAGATLIDLVARRWPKIRLLVTGSDATLRSVQLPGDARLCEKPCGPAQVTAIMVELLGQPRQRPN